MSAMPMSGACFRSSHGLSEIEHANSKFRPTNRAFWIQDRKTRLCRLLRLQNFRSKSSRVLSEKRGCDDPGAKLNVLYSPENVVLSLARLGTAVTRVPIARQRLTFRIHLVLLDKVNCCFLRFRARHQTARGNQRMENGRTCLRACMLKKQHFPLLHAPGQLPRGLRRDA